MHIEDHVGDHCPVCKQGILLLRKGPYGAFLGCSQFPKCSFNAGWDDLNINAAKLRYIQKKGLVHLIRNKDKIWPSEDSYIHWIGNVCGIELEEAQE
jgi:ssDNA-binding Zn-finger/Zn-ribbon topoisomerase 1